MRKLKADLEPVEGAVGGEEPRGAEALRFAEVNDLWRNAVAAVFGGDSAAPRARPHEQRVRDVGRSKVATCGASTARAARRRGPWRARCWPCTATTAWCAPSVDNRQELLKMKFKEQGEDVEALRILPSTRDMKNRHPFREEPARAGGPAPSFVRPARSGPRAHGGAAGRRAPERRPRGGPRGAPGPLPRPAGQRRPQRRRGGAEVTPVSITAPKALNPAFVSFKTTVSTKLLHIHPISPHTASQSL